MAGEHLDLSSEPDGEALEQGASGEKPGGLRELRRFVGVTFSCCGVYARVYVNQEKTGYEGNCPRCARRLTLKIGPGGTDSRFFTAY